MEQQEQPKEHKVAEEYLSSLADLNLNSKPLINMLTILAEENMEHAAIIVKVVEQHISKVNSDVKLPVLYLLDSIVKNVGGEYIQLFSNCIVNIFCGVFEKVNEKVREKMYILRQTWNDVFTSQKLYTLDVKVNCMDPNWPITAKVVPKSPAIHVNPKFLQNDVDPSDMQAKLQAKQRHLLELQKRKLELELAATKQRLEEQEKQLNFQNDHRQPGGPIGPVQVSGSSIKSTTNSSHGQRNLMFGSQLKNQDMGNSFPNYHGPPPPIHRPPISNANPIVMNKRDPRLARQQISSHKQMEMKKLTGNQSMQMDGIDNSIRPPGTYEERENHIKPDNSNRSNLNNKLKSRSGGGGSNLLINKQRSTSSLSSSNRKDYSSKSTTGDVKLSRDRNSSSRNGSSKSSSNSSPSKYDSIRSSSRRRDKIDPTKRSQSSSNKESSSKSRDDKSSLSSSQSTSVPSKSSHFGNTSSTKGGSISPKSRHQNRRNKDTTKSPSPTIQDEKIVSTEIADLPTDKRIKLSSTTAESKLNKKSNNTTNSTSNTSTITTTTTATTEKLDQNKEAESSKDIDLRAFKTTTTTDNGSSEGIIKSEEIISSGTAKIVTTQSLIERADEMRTHKKRPSVDNKPDEQPIIKKSKQEKIDTLFGSEDVDLRTEIPTLGVVGGLIAPPPPNISNENENWDKVKGTTKLANRKVSPVKSSLEDVRAKLAKAARNNNYNFAGKARKNLISKTLMNEVQEESQDATDDNIRTIISQAQELLDTDNINADQYHTLVKTVIQINETNKLKEAQRRESLLDNKSVESSSSISSSSYKPKEQRKRMARIPKNDKTSNDNTELKGLESQIPPPSSAGQTSSYSDMPPGREEKEIKRKRQKESKWSTASPWEQQQQKNAMLSQKPSWMQSNSRSTSQSNQSYPQTNNNNIKGNGQQNAVAPVRGGPSGIPNPWQNPPAIIFANPHQQMHAASHLNPSATMTPSLISHHFSNSVDNPQADLVRTIPIDGVAKEIRVYDDIAIVFMDWDQPREIGFQNGQRRLIIDDQEPIALNFNDDFKTITINGSVHRIKFGFPSRELYIDNNWYECYFGGPPLSIPLDGQMHVIKIEGPPPQVNIGILRQDIVAGKINLIVDAHIIIPVFLDAKPQTFELNQSKHIIQFADQLTTVLIDNEPISVEFGGLPKSVNLGDKKYFIRFGTLPNGIVPSRINIKNMINKIKKIEEPAEFPTAVPVSLDATVDNKSLDIEMKELSINLPPTTTNNVGNSILADNTSNSEFSSIPTTTTSELKKETTTSVASSLPALGNVNIDELFQKLIASGILNNQPKQENKTEEENNSASNTSPIKKDPIITQIDLSKPETIKARQVGIVLKLFCGMQCSSCGLRFPPEQTMKYSQHLDWHFRQNRRDRDSTRKAHSRKWFYDLADWIQYEEIEDIEDREKNWFESQQQNDLDNLDDNSNQQRLTSPPPSCPAGPDDVDRACDVCHEKFEQFYNEELEEWHLRSATRIEDQLYHPICYQDFKASLNPKKEETPPPTDENDDNYDDDSVIIVKQEKSEEGKSIDAECFDDDDVIEVPMEEPSITEILDEDDDDDIAVEVSGVTELPIDKKDDNNKKSVEDSETNNENSEKQQNKDMSMEDDLMIQEPNIPFTDLDTYVERDPEELHSENSTSQSQFHNIKIKEEPKDIDEEEEDAFEDVGTFSAVEVVQDSSDQIMETTVPDADDSNSIHIIENENDDSSAAIVPDAEKSLVSMDGNINITDLSSSSTIGVNKIIINITKNVISNSNNIDERNKSDNSVVSTIPVITTTTTNNNSSISSIKQLFNSNSSNQDKIDSNHSTNSNNNSDKITTITTTTTTVETTDDNNDLSVKSSNSSSTNKPIIEFSYKSELENIVFTEVEKNESGFETSGLCSIM